ncbi:protein-disulfide reductase DsbD family protein [Gammaproteobacteria bacterium]|nr:protein-disulfide reductase DsbD family protein [Gammaproteobacteria bacterium]MDA9799483.1 protein-disulfide reductase DsbD family protein [Gammaproteobacteria bacterium]
MNSRILLYSFVFLSGFIFSKAQFEDKQILNVDEAFVLNTSFLENKIFISWNIKPGYYLYKKSILIKSGDDTIKHRYISKDESQISDEFFGESTIFKGALEVEAELIDVNLFKLQGIQVIYQGCAEGKYCYPKRIKSL